MNPVVRSRPSYDRSGRRDRPVWVSLLVAIAAVVPPVPVQSQDMGDGPEAAAGTAPPGVEAGAEHMRSAATQVVADDIRGALPRDLSPWGMFVDADWAVKTIMIGLVFASMLTWTVCLVKMVELASLRRAFQRDLGALASARSVVEVSATLAAGVARSLVRAGEAELALSAEAPDKDGIKERVASSLGRLEAACARRMAIGTGVLATVGATAPFIGLFGTVWGIMNSFIGISEAQTTNLAVVAPGIAEALLATALGLVAAVPAVIIYNHFARRIAAIRAMVSDMTAAVLRLVSRDLDRGHEPSTARLEAVE